MSVQMRRLRFFRAAPWAPRLAVLLLVVATSGCGYSLAGRGSFLPASIRIIAIPTFTNRTAVFNLETELTQKVRSEFIGRGRYRIQPEVEGADAVLTGIVVSVVGTPVDYDDNQQASRFMLTMTANVELQDVREKKVLWQNPSLLFRQDYNLQTGEASLDPAAFFGQDRNALDRMTSDFARTIVSAILEAF